MKSAAEMQKEIESFESDPNMNFAVSRKTTHLDLMKTSNNLDYQIKHAEKRIQDLQNQFVGVQKIEK